MTKIVDVYLGALHAALELYPPEVRRIGAASFPHSLQVSSATVRPLSEVLLCCYALPDDRENFSLKFSGRDTLGSSTVRIRGESR